MTAPIQEPTTQRQIAGNTWAGNQLFRRPSPVAAAVTIPGVEWLYVHSLTNWGDTGPTILDWALRNGSWDSSFPTFNINASDNVEVAKDGIYVYWIYAANVAWLSGATVNTIRLECARLGGETPAGSHGWGTGSYNDIVWGPQAWTTPTGIAQFLGIIPNGLDFFVFSPGSFPGAGPCEFSWRGTQDEDGTQVSDASIVVHWIIVRLGDEYVDPLIT